jgi:hypothetical protein
MGRHYVTFGQSHTHRVNGKTFDCDCVAVIEAETFEEGREKAFEAFGPVFATSYQDPQWDEKDMKYFPRGYIEL